MSDALFSASFVRFSMLVDGSIRAVIDIDPSERAKCLAILDKPGVPLVVARLTNQAAVEHDRSRMVEAPADPLPAHKLPTPLSSRVAMTCGEQSFWSFLGERTGMRSVDKEAAAGIVRHMCGVASRSEIKPGTPAAERWEDIRADYEHWQRTGEAA